MAFMRKTKNCAPHSFLIVLGIILLAVLLTWMIPAGEYQRIKGQNGVMMVEPGSYQQTECEPASVLRIPTYIVAGFTNNVALILVLLFSGGAFELVAKTGAITALLERLATRFQNRRYLFLIVLTVAFGVLCSNQAIQIFIPFAPVLVMVSRALGFDAVTGIAVLILGGGIGFSTGTLRTTTTLVAQKIAGLPPYSGLAFRSFSLVCFLAVTCPLLCLYARKTAAGSTGRRQEEKNERAEQKTVKAEQDGTIDRGITKGRQTLVLMITALLVGVMVVGSAFLGWGISDLAGMFLWMTFAVGLAAGMSPNEICLQFTRGAAGMLPAAILTGMGTSISVIFKEAGIIDTIVYELSGTVNQVPPMFRAAVLYLANTVINVFITSGTAQAAVVMPIFVPVSDMVGITRQTCVLAYNFGDGFSNYVLPTSSALMGVLGAAGVAYGTWMKFMWKIFLVWVCLSCVLVTVAQMICLGPL